MRLRRSLAATALVLLALPAGVAGAPRQALPPGWYRVSPLPASLQARMVGRSWHAGCPVALAQLRLLRVTFYGFDHRVHVGRMVVDATWASRLGGVFVRLYRERFPIYEMVPVDAYGGNDSVSIDHDNTSSFNCRNATGSSSWSNHAYGLAVDLDPLQNPYLDHGRTTHRGSLRYLDRSQRLPGMIHPGDATVQAFAAIGWGWGGSWSGSIQDLQHFSVNGR